MFIRKIIGFFCRKKRILVADIDNIGDILLLTPLLKKIKYKYPGYHVTFVCCPFAVNVIGSNENIDRIIVYDAYADKRNKIKFFLKIFCRFDLSFSVATVAQTAEFVNICALLSGAAVRYGRKFKGVEDHYTEEIKFDENELSYIGRTYCNIIKEEFFSCFVPEFRIPETEFKRSSGFLEKYCRKNYIFIHPGGKLYDISRRWPKEKYAELIKKITENFPDVKIYITGGKEDREIAEYILNSCISGNITDLTGELTFFQWCFIILNACAGITNDTATIHIASAFKVKTTVILGPTSEKLLISPDSSVKAIVSDVECRPCWTYSNKYSECPFFYQCFDKITADIVFNDIYAQLKEIDNENT